MKKIKTLPDVLYCAFHTFRSELGKGQLFYDEKIKVSHMCVNVYYLQEFIGTLVLVLCDATPIKLQLYADGTNWLNKATFEFIVSTKEDGTSRILSKLQNEKDNLKFAVGENGYHFFQEICRRIEMEPIVVHTQKTATSNID
ncbi:hypothetical protein A2755_02720 [Candidatus Wolfebacteria bacterium RIFCSPHIGHO2_01_FULL_48_22]|uniref:Uncharacterized protein n=2 Tax=Candidatus Wolfeibacteriota TaxID=1752735 RepID=A0A1F8DTW0_9BACT|nr:MAG: hypothetical protein A2755_02720 [Candidatus Wolfebacteria bacterium RIFCSPHIGHO2_01_FULL_48_22]OGM92216.1 MAG: hypothetical protein A2935_00345 [Candidatus Wolfebacteria bacterium RIFCSPLOWO2_01_FULL_47_17b]